MAWDSDTTSANDDELDSKPADNETPGKKTPTVGLKFKIKTIKPFGKGIGGGTRKATSAPKGEGRKGSTTKANALKNA